MIHSIFNPRYRYLTLAVLPALICVIYVSHYCQLCLPVQAQLADVKATSKAQEGQLPKICQVLFLVQFSQEDKTQGSWVGQAQVVPADGGFKMENVKTLVASGWWEGIGAYSMSPDGKRLLVTRTAPDATDGEQRNLVLVTLPGGKTKAMRDDAAGYGMLGWSSDGQLISYVSPIPVPYSVAFSPASSSFQLISSVSHGRFVRPVDMSPTRVLYVSAPDGRWRRKLQANVADAVWIPGRRVIVYTSYNEPGLAVHSAAGKKAVLFKGEDGGDLLLSEDGRRLLWATARKLRLLQVPTNPSNLFDQGAWTVITSFDLDPAYPTQYGALSNDGTLAVLGGPGRGLNSLLVVLNLITHKSLVHSYPGVMVQLGWSQDHGCVVGALFQPSKGGGSSDLAAIRVDPASITHTGPIDWHNPQSVTPRVLLEMPIQTRAITWKESPASARR